VTGYLSVTPLHNATGTPAMSVPLHWPPDGLPVGVHFAGRYGEEATLVSLARPAGDSPTMVRSCADTLKGRSTFGRQYQTFVMRRHDARFTPSVIYGTARALWGFSRELHQGREDRAILYPVVGRGPASPSVPWLT